MGLHDLYGRIVMSVWCGVPLTFKQPIDCYQFPKMTRYDNHEMILY